MIYVYLTGRQDPDLTAEYPVHFSSCQIGELTQFISYLLAVHSPETTAATLTTAIYSSTILLQIHISALGISKRTNAAVLSQKQD